MNILSNPAVYKKFYAALFAVLSVLVFVMSPTEGQQAFQVTAPEWYLVLASGLSAVGVERFKNEEQ